MNKRPLGGSPLVEKNWNLEPGGRAPGLGASADGGVAITRTEINHGKEGGEGAPLRRLVQTRGPRPGPPR